MIDKDIAAANIFFAAANIFFIGKRKKMLINR
jgi:hypothetical protein